MRMGSSEMPLCVFTDASVSVVNVDDGLSGYELKIMYQIEYLPIFSVPIENVVVALGLA